MEKRPWGSFTVLYDEWSTYKIKEIVVNPGKRLSLQRHRRRAEHWTIIEGSGLVTINNSSVSVMPNSTVHIPIRSIHRIENTSDDVLRFIEIQTGVYFGEDDIERLADDFGRV